MKDLIEILKNNSYPGRGIVIGRNAAGQACAYYFIMGRSANSRNRVFVECEDGIRTQAHDESKMEDPSLIIYHPVRRLGNALIVTNGDQTDTICQTGGFREGCMKREYEPDAPNFTPRISAVLQPDGAFEISILKAERTGGGEAGSNATETSESAPRCIREFFAYEGCDAGSAYFISTYEGDGNPLPTFAGEPIYVSLPEPEEVWAALNEDNKVSLYANVAGCVQIFNKNLGD